MKTLICLMLAATLFGSGHVNFRQVATSPTLDLACGNPIVCGGGGGFSAWPSANSVTAPLDLACGNPIVCGGGGGLLPTLPLIMLDVTIVG
ncbi:hypothetical protein [Herpetosiphon llansteffanensis]|uniref:hypothetical protein n=1 Tax=Herpetosiphon llansteffanensis TaxID=2094568 RepID=UPI000D7CC8AF|nr:hypothetical protein [Herpetosiphon llansteffanensis]